MVNKNCCKNNKIVKNVRIMSKFKNYWLLCDFYGNRFPWLRAIKGLWYPWVRPYGHMGARQASHPYSPYGPRQASGPYFSIWPCQ